MMRDWIFVPVIIQVFLTLFVYLRLMQVKKRAANEGRVDRVRIALRDDAWPDYVIQVNNNIRNQFELPVLFYAVTAFALILRAVDLTMVALAWSFVASRILHAAIHVGPNKVRWRGPSFVLGFLIVTAMWVKLFLHVAMHST